MTLRQIDNIFQGRPTSDGAGVKLYRAFTPSVPNIDPFLMLDEISSDNSSDYMGGFPDHPHRGFETVSYMLQGKIRHTDHLGNEGLLEDGAVQWMTAGRGVIHAEMPEKTDDGLHGFQLWINLPSHLKMQPAKYQEYSSDSFPVVCFGNQPAFNHVKVIAGRFIQTKHTTEGVKGPVTNIATHANYYDITIGKDQVLSFSTYPEHTVLLYCFEGSINIAGKILHNGQTAKLSYGEEVSLKAEVDARLLVLTGKPIGEPVVNYGPFVMNTSEEIDQAIRDYQTGNLVAR